MTELKKQARSEKEYQARSEKENRHWRFFGLFILPWFKFIFVFRMLKECSILGGQVIARLHMITYFGKRATLATGLAHLL